MTLPVSGSISMSQVAAELGLSPTARLSLGDPLCYSLAGKTVGQPISMSDFYGKTYQFNVIISSNTNNFNAYNAAISAGWNGTSALQLNVTVNSGIVVCSASSTTPAFVVNNFPSGTMIKITNNGYILGRGGTGGEVSRHGGGSTFPDSGTSGGNGIQTTGTVTLVITNNGVIGGGGGGGAGQYNTYGGSSNFAKSGGGGAPFGAAGLAAGPDSNYSGSSAGLGPAGGAGGAGGTGPNAGAGGSWGSTGGSGGHDGTSVYTLPGSSPGVSIYKTDGLATVNYIVYGSVYN